MDNYNLNFYKKKIGENIAKFRKEKKLSQKQLATLAGISPQTLSCIEIGINNPSFNVIIKIVQILNIPIAYIFTFDENIYTIENKQLLFLASKAFENVEYSKRKTIFKLIECFKKESN